MRLRYFFLTAVCAMAFAWPVWAHHSHGNYDMTGYIELKGTVEEVHWINPHSWIYLQVKDGESGQTVQWALEGASVTQLRRRGWAADSLKPGDEIGVRCHHLRDRSSGCLLGYVTVAGGEEKLFD